SPSQEPQIAFDFGPVSYSSVALADINNNGRQDVLVTGHAIVGGRNITLYQNNGGGDFSVVDDLPFKAVSYGAMAFSDVDGDGDQDLLITGRTNESTGGTISFPKLTATLYLNDGNGDFTEVSGTPFEPVECGSVAFADVDNDKDMDVFISGMGQTTVMGSEKVSILYLNDGSGNFSEDVTASFTPVSQSSALFMDAEDDGDMDLVLTGDSNSGLVANLYKNDGMGIFSEMSGLPFEGISSGQIATADVTNNSKTEADIIFTGLSNVGGEYKGIAKLYLNNGKGLFEENAECSFKGVEKSSVAFADVDGDRDKDVLIAGLDTATNKPVTKLYLNQDGSGNFVESKNNSFEGIMHGTLTFFDFDRDNDQDVLITGSGLADFSKTAVLYLNDGSGHFQKVSTGDFSGLSKPSIDYADIDNDQDQYFMISGSDSTKLYINDGKGFYTLAENEVFPGVENGSIAFG
ncbi:MAG TPA: VCBS repeat-containing protein, partial [Bacteroidales bacterium]|nr:VCBS repeat-containing protein [Bacteroidales bacterium]